MQYTPYTGKNCSRMELPHDRFWRRYHCSFAQTESAAGTTMTPRLIGPQDFTASKCALGSDARIPFRKSGGGPLRALPRSAVWMKKVAVIAAGVVLALSAAPISAAAEEAGSSRRTPSLAAKGTDRSTQRRQTADSRVRAPIAAASRKRSESAMGRSGESSGGRSRSRDTTWARGDRTGRSEIDSRLAEPRRASGHQEGVGEDAGSLESSDDGDDSYENYDTEEGLGSAERSSYDEHDHGGRNDDGDCGSYEQGTSGGWSSSSPGDSSEYSSYGSEEEEEEEEEGKENPSDDLSHEGSSRGGVVASNGGRGQLADSSPQRQLAPEDNENDNNNDNAVEVCVVTWNLAESTPSKKDLEFLRRAAAGSGLVAVGVQEIENLKLRRNEGGRTREWRRLLIQTLGRDFVRVGHHAMGAVQLTLFARREISDRVKVVKLTEVVCGVGNVLQNKGGIGAYVRVDRTTFLFVAAHLAAHQGKLEERNAGYWRIVTALDQEIPPAWVTHAARKRAKRAKATAAAAAAATARKLVDGAAEDPPPPLAPFSWEALPRPRGPFKDRVDRVFFFGDLNYRVDLSREDMELGVSVCGREGEGAEEKRRETRMGRRFRPGVTYPGAGRLDALLDLDQLTLARSQGKAFGGFAEARVTFEPTYKYDKGSRQFDTSRKMRPPAWTDRILFSPPGPLGVSSLAYESVPGCCHSDHRPVYARFKVRLAE